MPSYPLLPDDYAKYQRTHGYRKFELSNHLGNVMAVLTDRKYPVENGSTTQISFYKPEVANSQDYYAFGGLMPGRKWDDVTNSFGSYMYGFNGKVNDNEVYGERNFQNYGMRVSDSRLGRFWSVDPLFKKYPMLSSFQFASNSPVSGVDLDGLEYFYTADGTLLGRIGTSNSVRLVNENDAKMVIQGIKHANNGNSYTERLYGRLSCFGRSDDLGMTLPEMNLRATLATLKKAEAGRANPPLEYNSWFGTGNKFTEKSYAEDPSAYSKHPGYLKEAGGSPAGAFSWTDQDYEATSNSKEFNPACQEQASVNLMKKEGYEAALKGDMTEFKLSMSKRWTSLKEWSGQDLQEIFKERFKDELNGTSKIESPKGLLLERERKEVHWENK